MDTQLLTPPSIVARVVQLANDPDASIGDIGAVIAQDPAISVRILRAVNSAFYGVQQEVASIEHAVGFMGLRAVRNLVLCMALKQTVAAQDLGDFPIERFWECSLRRASAARCIARRVATAQPDEQFTIGICQDFGLLVMLRDDPKLCATYCGLLSRPAPARLTIERDYKSSSHDELGHELFTGWELPPDLAEPIRYHHDPDKAPAEYQVAARIAHAAEQLADMFEIEDKYKPAGKKSARTALEVLGLDPELLPELFDEASAEVAEAADMLEMHVAQQPDWALIAAAAAEGLAELNSSYESTSRELQSALAEQQRVTNKLQAINEQLEERVFIDELTGLANRRAFDEHLGRSLSIACREGREVTLLLVDLDHFKQINDTKGHQAGDAVLATVGRGLQATLRRGDFAARYGGEEFAVILPFSNDDGGAVAAERIRLVVEALKIPFEGQEIRVTASIGGASCAGSNEERAGVHLIRSADDALYEAKKGGRNRVSWAASPAP